jgi:hypothetical protein
MGSVLFAFAPEVGWTFCRGVEVRGILSETTHVAVMKGV